MYRTCTSFKVVTEVIHCSLPAMTQTDNSDINVRHLSSKCCDNVLPRIKRFPILLDARVGRLARDEGRERRHKVAPSNSRARASTTSPTAVHTGHRAPEYTDSCIMCLFPRTPAARSRRVSASKQKLDRIHAQHSPGVISEWPDRKPNPGPPERESSELPLRHLARRTLQFASFRGNVRHTSSYMVIVTVSLLAYHLIDPGSIPGLATADFMWESCRTMPFVGGYSRGSPVSPALSFRHCSMLTSITLIGSQDLDDIHGDSSPFLLQPFHELSKGFWPRLTSPHPAIQFVPRMFCRVEVGALGRPVQSANIVVVVRLHISP
ncbi:hypothetical protein PR048_016718 [Dryococelus australis]|uniref:Uncharacterized protein n=1 Tax=Dryococelus australis TaxID=614101 RepID=A0ABQ9H7K5_9NEOP|nr:hypothetical protein PR048_016718 [Dryococelus australis]